MTRLGRLVAASWRARRASFGRAAIVVLPGLVLWLLFLVTGLRGVDFGFHWDEVESHVGPTRAMVQNGILLPRIYTYPMLTKWMVLVPALPAGIGAAFDTGDPRAVQRALLAAMDAPGFLLAVRRLFIGVSSLTIVWVYAAGLVLGHRPFHAAVAAGAMALSWELAYHSRFAVPDCTVVQFSALALLGLALHRRTGQASYLYALAVVAGLATGTKYPAIFLLFPILLASVFSLSWKAAFTQLGRGTALVVLTLFVFGLTTPAAWIDPFQFVEGAKNISKYYATVGHGGYTVASAGAHAKLTFEYLILDFFSAYRPLAVAMFACSIAGGVLWLRRDVRFGLVLLALPVTFATFFCVKYRLVTVRNYLFFTPFLAILLARVTTDVEEWLRRPWQRRSLRAVWLVLGLLEARFLILAAESIRRPRPKLYVREAFAYVKEHPELRFRLSPQVRSIAESIRLRLPPNVTTEKADAVVFFNQAEGGNPWQRATNDPWLTLAVFGTKEVNINWYATWGGPDRVVVMTPEKARASLAPIAQ